MSASMRFTGQLCFCDADHLSRALAVIEAEPESVVRPNSFEREHLMLRVELDTSAPAGMWGPTCIALGRAAEHAHSGMVVCKYGEAPDEESDVVLAENWEREADAPRRGGLLGRVRRWLGGAPTGDRSASRWWKRTRPTFEARSYRFAFDDCTVLVLYALGDHGTEPTTAASSFVVGAPGEPLPGGLASDVAPYFMEYYLPELEKDLNRAIATTAPDSPLHHALLEGLSWMHDQRGQGFAVQLEPPAIAGDGTARHRGLEAEGRGRTSTDDDDAPRPTTPWKRTERNYRCPKCGSTETKSQYTSALGDRFVEASCNDCNHYDSWFDRGDWEVESDEADDDGADADLGIVAPPAPRWIEIGAGVFELGLTDAEAETLARDSAAVARYRAEYDPDQLHGFREAAEVEMYAGNTDYLLELLRRALPPWRVELAAFEIARDPVTVAEYQAFLDGTNHPPPKRWSRHKLGRLDVPVSDVSWHDAVAFAAWAGSRLPSEAEWARAARGTERRLYPWGNTYGEEGHWMEDQEYVTRGPIGHAPRLASSDGVFDMVTRHWEWCSDTFVPYPGADLDALRALWSDYPDEKTNARVLRGAEGAHLVACAAARIGVDPTMAVMGAGFRLARSR